MSMDDEQLVVFSRPRIAKLADVSERRLDYWHRTGLIVPEVDRRVTQRRSARLYAYRDALSVLTVATMLRSPGVSLQHVRQVVARVRSLAYDIPELTFAVVGRSIYFQTPDGEWEDGRQPGQTVLKQVLDLRPLRAQLEASTRREPEAVGQVEKRRGAHGSRPVLAGTRVPVASVQAFLARGASVAEVLEAYPVLEAADVEKARALASA